MRLLGRRFLQLIVVMFLLSIVAFGSIRMLPGDPAELLVPGIDQARIEQAREDLGLKKPLYEQYGKWAGNFVTGDFGKYYRAAGDPTGDVKTSLPISLQLMLYTQIVALVIAIPLGVLTAYKSDSFFDKGANIFAFLGLSIPAFVVGYLLKQVFVFQLDWFPERGWVPLSESVSGHFKAAVLPVATLVIAQIAVYFRLLRSDMIGTLQEDFITMARAKGLKSRRILFRHALRPSSLTLLTVAGLNVGTLISSAVIVENIYGIDGMGLKLVRSVLSREYVAAQSFIAVIGILFVLINFLVDFLYTVLDPRIRHA
ncbi:MAG TPA: ABC transporter permease [Microthrixaceae bacterium]|nr:ABC transporter permease [Microthrixaceae bacterium]